MLFFGHIHERFTCERVAIPLSCDPGRPSIHVSQRERQHNKGREGNCYTALQMVSGRPLLLSDDECGGRYILQDFTGPHPKPCVFFEQNRLGRSGPHLGGIWSTSGPHLGGTWGGSGHPPHHQGYIILLPSVLRYDVM